MLISGKPRGKEKVCELYLEEMVTALGFNFDGELSTACCVPAVPRELA